MKERTVHLQYRCESGVFGQQVVPGEQKGCPRGRLVGTDQLLPVPVVRLSIFYMLSSKRDSRHYLYSGKMFRFFVHLHSLQTHSNCA